MLIGCNGIPIYEDADWLKEKYIIDGMNQDQIASICNVPRSIIKMRVKKFKLHKTKSEWMKGHLVKKETIEKILRINAENFVLQD